MFSPIATLIALLALTAAGDSETGEASGIDRSKLQKITAVDHESPEGTKFMEGVRKVLDTELSGGDRRRLGHKVLSPRRVVIAQGNFAGGGAVVSVSVDLHKKAPEDPQHYISGVFVLSSSGDLGEIIEAPKMREASYELTGIGDVDGDGKDDIAYDKKVGETSDGQLARSGAPKAAPEPAAPAPEPTK